MSLLCTPPKPKLVQHDRACQENMITGSPVCICGGYTRRALSKHSFTDPASRARGTPRFAHAATVVSFRRNPPKLFLPGLTVHDSYFQRAFTNITEIGFGSFGTVYSARSIADGKEYAVKRSHHIYNSSARRMRMLQEVRLHEFLPPHKNIVGFVMAWEERDRLYIQLELCGRQNLSQLHNPSNPVKDDKIWEWAEGFANALIHIHDHDIIHLDVKPDNMFIGFDGECKLGDFGSAVDLITDDLSDFDDGDSRYLAPEVLNHKPSKAADIYSLGMALLELSSKVGFDRIHFDSSAEMREAAFNGLKDRELKKLISKMVHSDPSQRPTARGVLQLVRRHNNRNFYRFIMFIVTVLVVLNLYLLFTFI